jgi:outer membrane protein OmpA-like peptidoglycan-associated protein
MYLCTFPKIMMSDVRLLLIVCASWAFSGLQAQIVNPAACEPTADKAALKAFEKAEKQSGEDKLKALSEIITRYPDFHEALFSQAMALIQREKFSAAGARFEKVYALCPDYSPYTWYYLGAIYYGAEKYAEAIPYLEKVAKYDGDLKLKDKDYDEAKAMLKTARATLEITANRFDFQPAPVNNVCTPYDEYTANLSPDNETLYFIRKIPDGKSSVGYRELFMESAQTNRQFDAGRELPPPFNMSSNNGAASITADNKTMYFVICQNNDYKACDIWYSERKGIAWSPLNPVQGKLNKGTDWDSQPSVSYDGNEMYFVSDRPSGFGGSDIYVSRKQPDGTWGEAQNLGSVINSDKNELTPFLHSDSKTLYFSSKGHNNLGGYDIFFSRQNPDGTWNKPKNLGSPINTQNDEVSFFVSLDGKQGFFSSDKLKGPGGKDLFSFPLYAEARPKEVKLIKGEIKTDLNTPRDAEVEIKNLNTKETVKVAVDKTDGKFVAVVDSDQDYLMTLKKEGIAFNSVLIEKENQTETGTVKAELEMKKIEPGKAYDIRNVYFATNSVAITAKTEAILEAFADFLKTNPTLRVAIQGHTDNVGDDAANLLLSENRAKAVAELLRNKGVSANRIIHKGFGETKPLYDNSTEEGRAKNRRTEFLILSE